MNRPYSLGHNGHAKKCDCTKCAKSKARAFKFKLEVVTTLDERFARAPISSDQTVFVRAHFKRSPNHLRRFPRARMLIRRTLKGAL